MLSELEIRELEKAKKALNRLNKVLNEITRIETDYVIYISIIRDIELSRSRLENHIKYLILKKN